MRRYALVAAGVFALLTAVEPARALQEGVGAAGLRVGTLGVGADLGIALNERFALRAGAGFLGFDMDLTGRFGLADNRTAELSLPSMLLTFGAEFSSGARRAEAGVLIMTDDPVHTIEYGSGASIDIGGGSYRQPEVLTLATTLTSAPVAPYLLVGYGSTRSRGLDFMADIGVAFLQGTALEMSATGSSDVLGSASFRTDLEAERRETEDDAGGLIRFWPIVSIGLRYGF